LFVAIILVRFFNLLKRYITDTEFILSTLFDDAERLFK
jgi:biopolymer transport protein ExbB/TolQ